MATEFGTATCTTCGGMAICLNCKGVEADAIARELAKARIEFIDDKPTLAGFDFAALVDRARAYIGAK